MHYYQFNIADYRKDTTHLSRLEHSIYRDLIDWCYLEECSIPLDLAIVYRRLRLSSTDDERALNAVLTDFFECTNEGYTQKRIQAEIAAYHLQIENASKAGKASAEARKNKQLEREFNGRSTNQEPITNNQYISTDVDIKPAREKAPRFDAQAHLVELGVPPLIAGDWITLRKSKKAPVTQTAIRGVEQEACKAGISIAEAMATCCQRGWAGFKADWIAGDKPINGKTQYQIDQEATARAFFGNSVQQEPRLIAGEVVQ